MTIQELIAQLQQELEQAEADVAAKQHALRSAENHAAFIRGQLFVLTQRINITEPKPLYSDGQEPSAPEA